MYVHTTYVYSYQRQWAWDREPTPTEMKDRWESRANTSKVVRAVQHGEDWKEALEIDVSKVKEDPENKMKIESLNTACLFAIREALKKKNYDLAWDIAVYSGRKIDCNTGEGPGYAMVALAAERGYGDVYFFLIERIKNPCAPGGPDDATIMDFLDQGIKDYGMNETYQLIKQDLTNRGVELRTRKPEGGCCLIQ